MSLPAADSRARRPRIRRRTAAALAGALCAAGVLTGAASADTSTPVFFDSRAEPGAEIDLISSQVTHVENNAATADDDQLLLTARLDRAGQGARFSDGDIVLWYLNTDSDPATGGPATVPGFSAIGAEYRVGLFGMTSGSPDVEISRWNGLTFTVVRDLTSSELVISELSGIVGVQVPRADLGVARGSTLSVVLGATTTAGTWDYAPDRPPQYTLAIPPAPTAPVVAASAATVAAGESSLTVGATVDPRGLPTSFRFQYGTTAAYGSETTTGDAGAGTTPVPVTATVTGLQPGTTYNFRVVATNAAGTTFGPNQAATTIGPVPTAQTSDATVTGARSALLTGIVGTRGVAGKAYFVWGAKASALTSRTPPRKVTGDKVGVRAVLDDLTPNHRYHYRVVVESPGGRAEGKIMSFVARRIRVVADVAAVRGPGTGTRTSLKGLDVTVRTVSARSGRSVAAPRDPAARAPHRLVPQRLPPLPDGGPRRPGRAGETRSRPPGQLLGHGVAGALGVGLPHRPARGRAGAGRCRAAVHRRPRPPVPLRERLHDPRAGRGPRAGPERDPRQPRRRDRDAPLRARRRPHRRLPAPVSTYERIAGLPVRIEGYALEVLRLDLAEDFQRLTTVIHLHGGGEEGLGEDVCYDPADHLAQEAAGPWLPLAGAHTIEGFSRHLEPFDLFTGSEPGYPGSREYRRWAFESAALDLACRQAGTSLADALGITPRPVTFVVSTRLDEPADAGRVHAWLAREPSLRFKLDPTDTWTAGADRGAARARRGADHRPEGLLHGHPGRRQLRPGALPAPRDGPPRRPGSRTPASPRRSAPSWPDTRTG